MAKTDKDKISGSVNIKNKRAGFEYQFLDTYVAGVMLTGTEIKSIRMGNVNINDGYCFFNNGELWIKSLHISTYKEGTHFNQDPLRERKLLLKKQELSKLETKSQEKGLTIIPIRLFTSDRGFAKIEIALAKGKKIHDKRDDIKARDVKREMDRDL